MATESVRCNGIVAGRPCSNTTSDPSGFCHQHRNQKLLAGIGAPMASSHLKSLQSASNMLSGSDAWMNGMSRSLRPEQKQIADAAFDLYGDPERDRASVRAACGMGKTTMEQAVMAKISDHLQSEQDRSGNFLIVVPTVNLANQMREDILSDGVLAGVEYDKNSLNSDLLIVHNESEQFKGTADKDAAHKKIVADFMQNDNGAPKVVICVIDSIDKVAGGQGDENFDMAFFDEAHNYAAEVGANGSPVKPIYFNEQQGGIQADNRLFLTATPKMQSKHYRLTTGFEDSAKGKNRDRLVELSGKSKLTAKDKFNLAQDGTSSDVFGAHIGSWGYRHAIDNGYLSPVNIYSHNVTAVQGANSTVDVSDFTRATRVDALGNETSDSRSISMGAYISLRTTADALVDSDSRNVLAFSNSVEECQEIGRSWEEYLQDLAAASNGGRRFSSDDEARMAIVQQSMNPERARAGKYHLLSRHAQQTTSWSKASQKQKDEAEQFFDKREIGDAAPCTCEGRESGQWCACARIVNNVDMLSEGISINSIDTVILNRPGYSSDKDITQALGRASRKMKGVNGEDNIKGNGKVIIPRSMATIAGYEDQWSRPIEDRAYLKSLSAINRIWNDVDGHYLDNSTVPLPDMGDESPTIYGLDPRKDSVQGTVRSEVTHIATSDGRLGVDQYNAILNNAWTLASDKARAQWTADNKGNKSWSDLTNLEKENLSKAQALWVSETMNKRAGSVRARVSVSILQGSDWDQFQASQRYMEVMDDRGAAGEFGIGTLKDDSNSWRKRAQTAKSTNPGQFIEMEYWDSMAAAYINQAVAN